jgi:hypothetical protein
MTYRFKKGMKYSGEALYGGCGNIDRNFVTILERTKSHITYREKHGNVEKVKREFNIKCEFFSTRYEDFYADSLEPN